MKKLLAGNNDNYQLLKNCIIKKPPTLHVEGHFVTPAGFKPATLRAEI